jgi:hypothetical protein
MIQPISDPFTLSGTVRVESIQTPFLFPHFLRYSRIIKWIKYFFLPHQSTHNTHNDKAKTGL